MSESDDFSGKLFEIIGRDYARVINLLNVQVRSLVFFGRISKRIILSDIWSQLYIFGAFDALGERFPLEVRRRLGPVILDMCFKGYLRREFLLSDAEASKYLEKCFLLHQDDPSREPIVFGGGDGVSAMLEQDAATRLLDHFGFDHEGGLSSGEAAAFRNFCARQDDEPTL